MSANEESTSKSSPRTITEILDDMNENRKVFLARDAELQKELMGALRKSHKIGKSPQKNKMSDEFCAAFDQPTDTAATVEEAIRWVSEYIDEHGLGGGTEEAPVFTKDDKLASLFPHHEGDTMTFEEIEAQLMFHHKNGRGAMKPRVAEVLGLAKGTEVTHNHMVKLINAYIGNNELRSGNTITLNDELKEIFETSDDTIKNTQLMKLASNCREKQEKKTKAKGKAKGEAKAKGKKSDKKSDKAKGKAKAKTSTKKSDKAKGKGKAKAK